MSNAFVQKQAPEFEAEAVLPSGQFGKVKLSDYKGELLILSSLFTCLRLTTNLSTK